MSTTTLSQEDQLLLGAVHTAAVALQQARYKPYVTAKEVRSILNDISADTLAPLPAPVQVVMPGNDDRIIGQEGLASIINHLKDFGRSLMK